MDVKRTPKGVRTKQRIISSSIELIHGKGIENVTLNDICSASGIAQGTFYHHFKSMDGILLEIIRGEGEEISALMESIEELSASEKLETLLKTLFRYYEQKGKEIVSQLYRLELKPEGGPSIIEEYLPIRPLIDRVIRKGQESGEFSKGESPDFLCSLLTSQIIFQSFLWIRSPCDASFSSFADKAVEPVIKLIKS
ncbi:MAG: TetR/AcrR family transcriptional regulator [Spirochaetales bacterium]|nr:TetR/AcrR family transcriptional regulator [Spirochaetales bacterium]